MHILDVKLERRQKQEAKPIKFCFKCNKYVNFLPFFDYVSHSLSYPLTRSLLTIVEALDMVLL